MKNRAPASIDFIRPGRPAVSASALRAGSRRPPRLRYDLAIVTRELRLLRSRTVGATVSPRRAKQSG